MDINNELEHKMPDQETTQRMALNDMAMIKAIFDQVLDERERSSQIPREEHTRHHAFLAECIPLLKDFLEERHRKRMVIERWRTSLIGAVALAIVGSIVTALGWIGHLVIASIQAGQHPK